MAERTPIRHLVTVRAPAAEAFRVFTEELGAWWPVKRSPADAGLAEEALMEPRLGGSVRERWDDGRLNAGEIVAWEPPRRLVFSWLVGGDEERATEVEVRFSAAGDETRVELEHRGWDELGAAAEATQRGYAVGWAAALRRFASTADERERSRSCSCIPT